MLLVQSTINIEIFINAQTKNYSRNKKRTTIKVNILSNILCLPSFRH